MTSADAAPAKKRPKKLSDDQLAATVVLGIHRLVKHAKAKPTGGDAQRRQLAMTQKAIAAYGRRMSTNPRLFFTESSVFVGGRLLRAGRTVYAAALELGRILDGGGVDEVTVGHDVSLDELRAFQVRVASLLRGEEIELAADDYERILLRRGVPPGRRPIETDTSPQEQIVRGYATAIVVMRRFLQEVQAGRYELPLRVRRVAQQLADLGAVESSAFTAGIALANARHEHAGRAVNSALIALGMARQLREDKRSLSRIAMACLLFDAGLPLVAGADPLGEQRSGLILPRLGDAQRGELPAATAAATVALAGISDVSRAVTTMIFEAQHLVERAHAGAPYDGLRPPTLEARIVATAVRFTRLVANPDEERTADQAVGVMLEDAQDDAERTVLRLLLGALALFPTGTIVELDDHATAQVIRVHDEPMRMAQPRIQLLTSADGSVSREVIELGDGAHTIARLVELPTPEKRREALALGAAASVDDEPRPAALPPEPEARPRQASVLDPREEQEFEGAFGGFFDDTDPRPPVMDGAAGGEFILEEEEEEEEEEADDDVPSLVKQALVDGRDSAPPAPEQPPSASDARGTPPAASSEAPASGPKSALGASALVGRAGRKPSLFSRDRRELLGGSSAPPSESLPPNDSSAPAASRRSAALRQWLDEKTEGLTPAASGHFGKTPLPHLLVFMLDRRLTGTLVVTEDDGSANVVVFDDGAAGKVRLCGGASPLDQVLLELGYLDEATLAESLRAVSGSGDLHGRHLVRQGFLDVSRVKAALAWQVRRKVEHLFSLPPSTTYGFFNQANLLDDYGGPEMTPVEPLSLVMAGVRQLVGHALVTKTLDRLGGTPLRLRREAEPRRLDLTEEEQRALEAVRARPLNLDELVMRDVAPAGVCERLVYALVVTRSLRLGDQQRAVVGIDRPAFPLRPPLATEPASADPGGVDRPAPRRSTTTGRDIGDEGAPRRETSSSRGDPLPRRGSSSTRDEEPLPRRGSNSTRGQPPRRGTSSRGLPRRGTGSHQDPLPRRGSSSSADPLEASPAVPPARTPPARPSPPERPSRPRRPSTPARSDRADRSASPRKASDPGFAVETSRSSQPGKSSQPGGSEPPISVPTASQRQRSAQVGPPRVSRKSNPGSAPAPTSQRGQVQPPPASNRAGGRGGPTREEIQARLEASDSSTYFEILGVTKDDPPSVVQKAYFDLAKSWHPDRLGADLGDLKADVAKIFGRVNEAFQTLSNPKKRAEYVERVDQGGGTAKDREIVQNVMDSAMVFQKAEVLYAKGKVAAALPLVKQAMENDPQQPEYRTLYAWLAAEAAGLPPKGKEGSHYHEQLELLDEVLREEPRFEKALFYRGQLRKRAGAIEGAIKDFRKVVRINPKNLDAAREVRLHDMRERKKGGLLGRLFGKK